MVKQPVVDQISHGGVDDSIGEAQGILGRWSYFAWYCFWWVFLVSRPGTYPPFKEMNVDTHCTHFTKINSIWVTDIQVKQKTIKLLEDNIGENLVVIGSDDDFSDTVPRAESIKMDKLGLKNFCSAKDTVKKMRKQDTD